MALVIRCDLCILGSPGIWSIQWYNFYDILLVINKYKHLFNRAIKTTSVRQNIILDWRKHRLTSWTIWFLCKRKKVITQRKAWRWVKNFHLQIFSFGSNHTLIKAILKMLVETLELRWIGNEYLIVDYDEFLTNKLVSAVQLTVFHKDSRWLLLQSKSPICNQFETINSETT